MIDKVSLKGGDTYIVLCSALIGKSNNNDLFTQILTYTKQVAPVVESQFGYSYSEPAVVIDFDDFGGYLGQIKLKNRMPE